MEGLIPITIVAFAGIIVFVAIMLKPKLFWPLLTIISVGTMGLMIQGHCLIEEYLIGCLVIGAFLVMSVKNVYCGSKKENIWDHFHKIAFLLLIIYMIVQSVRGLLLWEDLRLIRWIGYYAILGMLALIISKKKFPTPDTKKLSVLIAGSTIIYLGLYLAHGFFSEIVRGISRWDLQGAEWSGSAYAVFPLVIALPAAIFLIRERSNLLKWVGLVVIITAVAVAICYDSRITLLIIIAFFLVALPKIGLRRLFLLLSLSLILFSGVFFFGDTAKFTDQIKSHSQALLESACALWAPRESDLDRFLHFQASFDAIEESETTLLFGYGVHSHRSVLSSYIKDSYRQNLPKVKVGDDIRTTGFTALLVDTGLIGILLLLANFLCVARKIIIQMNSPGRTILLTSLTMLFLWLFVGNIQDIMLFYLLIMPSGLLIQLSCYKLK